MKLGSLSLCAIVSRCRFLLGLLLLCITPGLRAEAPDGRELFTREWLPNDPRGHGGDGLGPVFNDTSCVACHNQGGAGGAGSRAKNVRIVTAFASNRSVLQPQPASRGIVTTALRGILGSPSSHERQPEADPGLAKKAQEIRDEVVRIHPGFRTARSVVLHRFGLDDEYSAWRTWIHGNPLTQAREGAGFNFSFGSGPIGLEGEARQRKSREIADVRFVRLNGFDPKQRQSSFHFVSSERNPLALFGLGRIDSIPDAAILNAAELRHREFPTVSGRVARLKDGRLGRFGWKGQTATLQDFVRTACAVELGLHVPGEAQSGMPHKPDYKAPGLDMTDEDVSTLASFIAALPPPTPARSVHEKHAAYLQCGEALFGKVGCEDCHRRRLGEVDGIYSDLLLHDLGAELGDSGSYGAFAPDRTEEEELTGLLPALVISRRGLSGADDSGDQEKAIGAKRLEWRTPPLWGLRDSAPYLHDGRAETLDQAIAFHGGEADRSSDLYFELSADEREQLRAFLRSLSAP